MNGGSHHNLISGIYHSCEKREYAIISHIFIPSTFLHKNESYISIYTTLQKLIIKTHTHKYGIHKNESYNRIHTCSLKNRLRKKGKKKKKESYNSMHTTLLKPVNQRLSLNLRTKISKAGLLKSPF